jgi:hypothetical protein
VSRLNGRPPEAFTYHAHLFARLGMGVPWSSHSHGDMRRVRRQLRLIAVRLIAGHGGQLNHSIVPFSFQLLCNKRQVLSVVAACITPLTNSQRDNQAQLVNYLDPVARDDVARDTFCVFLVTPSFASGLADEKTFLSQAINRLYSKAAGAGVERLSVHALCAVVDKLPAGRALGASETIQDAITRRSTEWPAGESGYEGIAYVTLPASASVPSTSPRSPDKGAIDFIVSRRDFSNNPRRDVWRLPLANTVFQTGSPTTMFYTKWAVDSRKKMVELEERTDVTHHGVSIGNTVVGSTKIWNKMSSVLSIPLLPLTIPRLVEGCMGNIIRRVTGPDKESVTASSELEKVVPRFFQARGEPAQATTAWALVIPKRDSKGLVNRTRRLLAKRLSHKEKGTLDTEILWDRLWQAEPPTWNTLVSSALAKGARLHRVLSGGGGWGKKAGLLSLDPGPISGEVPIRMEDASSGFDGPGDFSDALTPVVRDGDYIQFFISPTSTPQIDANMALDELKAIPKQRTLGWELGIIPSTMDSMPGGSWQHVSDSEYIAVFKNSFGALSETGMMLTRSRGESSTAALQPYMTTTIDVPYSRFWTVELGDEKKECSADDVGEQEVE